MKEMVIVFAALLAAAAPAFAAEGERVCLDAAQTRAAVRDHGLTDPGTAQRTAATQARAEALRARLCRWNEVYVYEITLLRRDGKVMHVNVRAADGTVAGSPGDR
jgi:uncharacterized membrane protein YkoI